MMIPRGYLRFPRVYLHITPSHVHAPASAPGFSHWTSIRPLSSVPSPLFCLRFLVSLFLLCLFFFFFCISARGVKDQIYVRKLATKRLKSVRVTLNRFSSRINREIYLSHQSKVIAKLGFQMFEIYIQIYVCIDLMNFILVSFFVCFTVK